MGNSRSRSRRNRNSAFATNHSVEEANRNNNNSNNNNNNRGSESIDHDLQHLAELLFLRQELEQRQEALRLSLDGQRRRRLTSGSSSSSSDDGSDDGNTPSGLIRRLVRHHLLLDYLDRNADDIADSDDESSQSDRSDSDSDTFEGVPELFAEDDETLNPEHLETEIRERGEKMGRFRSAMLDLLEEKRSFVEQKIDAALDVQRTLRDLLRDQEIEGDESESVSGLIRDIRSGKDFVDKCGIAKLNRSLDNLTALTDTLKDLTSVRSEDEVVCSVCLACPTGTILDCVACNGLLCHSCKSRVVSCPTCRVKFRRKPPRRNRWAEKLARMQREKEASLQSASNNAQETLPAIIAWD